MAASGIRDVTWPPVCEVHCLREAQSGLTRAAAGSFERCFFRHSVFAIVHCGPSAVSIARLEVYHVVRVA